MASKAQLNTSDILIKIITITEWSRLELGLLGEVMVLALGSGKISRECSSLKIILAGSLKHRSFRKALSFKGRILEVDWATLNPLFATKIT